MYMCIYVYLLSHSVMLDSLWPARLLCPWSFPGKNTGVGCHFLLQGIILTQAFKPHLLNSLYWEADSLPLHHLGSCVYKYPIFIYSSVDGHLGCFHILAIINNVVVNIGVHVSF